MKQDIIITALLCILPVSAALLIPLPEKQIPPAIPAEINAPPEEAELYEKAAAPELSASAAAGLFAVKPLPAPTAVPVKSPTEPEQKPEELRKAQLPPLPQIRYLGEAVINGSTIIFCMTGSPERLIRLPDAAEKEFSLMENNPESLTINYNGRSIHVPK